MKSIIVLDGGEWNKFSSLIEYRYNVVMVIENGCDRVEKGVDFLSVVGDTSYDEILIAGFRNPQPIKKQLMQQGIDKDKVLNFRELYLDLINDCPDSISDSFMSSKSFILKRHREMFGTHSQTGSERFISSICRPSDCLRLRNDPPYSKRVGQLNRKEWERIYIYHSLKERDMLVPGKKGLGFACGKESLPSIFANLGCHITASDAPPEIVAESWLKTNQHGDQLGDLFHPAFVDSDKFYENTNFKYIDMNHIPYDEKGYDFIWSSCALEHLGSLHNAKQFIYRSMECLKEGGIAVHTTEYNLSSSLTTVMTGDSCIFRSIDLIEVAEQLERSGYHVEPLDFRLDGSKLDDHAADNNPNNIPHFKLFIDKFMATSFGLIIRK
jgi:2-polyprenyl-3-methyl-5-hydroxy-6-metoxy-1,4-benzoquinol methylase